MKIIYKNLDEILDETVEKRFSQGHGQNKICDFIIKNHYISDLKIGRYVDSPSSEFHLKDYFIKIVKENSEDNFRVLTMIKQQNIYIINSSFRKEFEVLLNQTNLLNGNCHGGDENELTSFSELKNSLLDGYFRFEIEYKNQNQNISFFSIDVTVDTKGKNIFIGNDDLWNAYFEDEEQKNIFVSETQKLLKKYDKFFIELNADKGSLIPLVIK